MKKLLISLVGAVTLGVTLPSIAGPDFQAIERARKARHTTQHATMPTSAASAATEMSDGAPQKLVLPLDHGPRAQTTPWLNRQRVLRADAEARALRASRSEAATAGSTRNQ